MDPVLSPSIALGIYENYEREIFRRLCKPGSVVVDVGANVGLYTVIAASRVGRNGKVIAIGERHDKLQYSPRDFRRSRAALICIKDGINLEALLEQG